MSSYKQAIHQAVNESEGRDFYTKEDLDWSLISTYDNREAQRQGVEYKRRFALLPTVDRTDPESKQADFRICGWRTNDCKNDLKIEELTEFCQKLLHAGARVPDHIEVGIEAPTPPVAAGSCVPTEAVQSKSGEETPV